MDTKSNALWKSIGINSPLSSYERPQPEEKHRHNSSWTWTVLGNNCLSNTVALCLNSFALLDLNWLTQDHLSSLCNHCTGWSANQIVFQCIMERWRFPLWSKLIASPESLFRQNVEVLLQISDLSFFLKRDIKEHQMRTIKVIKGSQAYPSHLPMWKTVVWLKPPT